MVNLSVSSDHDSLLDTGLWDPAFHRLSREREENERMREPETQWRKYLICAVRQFLTNLQMERYCEMVI